MLGPEAGDDCVCVGFWELACAAAGVVKRRRKATRAERRAGIVRLSGAIVMVGGLLSRFWFEEDEVQVHRWREGDKSLLLEFTR